MNRKHILEIARALVDRVAKFDMGSSTVKPACNSAGCIAGHIAYLHPRRRTGVDHYKNPRGDIQLEAGHELIGAYFEIDDYDADKIYLGADWRMRDIDRWTAAAALVKYLRTGGVDFSPVTRGAARRSVELAEKEFLI